MPSRRTRRKGTALYDAVRPVGRAPEADDERQPRARPAHRRPRSRLAKLTEAGDRCRAGARMSSSTRSRSARAADVNAADCTRTATGGRRLQRRRRQRASAPPTAHSAASSTARGSSPTSPPPARVTSPACAVRAAGAASDDRAPDPGRERNRGLLPRSVARQPDHRRRSSSPWPRCSSPWRAPPAAVAAVRPRSPACSSRTSARRDLAERAPALRPPASSRCSAGPSVR